MQGRVRQISWIIAIAALNGAAIADPNISVINSDPPSEFHTQIQWAEHVQPMPPSNEETRRQFEQLRESLISQSFDEAETTAKQIVESVTAAFPDDTLSRSRALHNLALVQQLRADFSAAILNYETAIDVVVSTENLLSADLVAPLHALALAYGDSNQPLQAMRTLDRALHISNVNAGPHSPTQIPILQSIVQLHADQGDIGSASEVLDRIYSLYTRRFDRDSEALLPVIYELATFYKEHDMYTREYMAWSEVLSILRRNRGKNDLALVEPQLNLGRNMIREMKRMKFRSGPTADSAEKYLKRALATAEYHPDADWHIKRRCLLALADYYMLLGMHAQGHRYYQEAWQLLSTEESLYAQRATDLEVIVPISRPHPDPYANFEYNPDVEKINPDDYRSGLLVAEFAINRRGRAQDISIVESDPPDFNRMEWRLKAALKDFVYRPRFENGEPRRTENYQYRLEYFYLPSEYEASRTKSGKLTRPRPPETH